MTYTLITGATSGIGLKCAHSYAEKWYNLILVWRNSTKLDTVKNDICSKYTVDIICKIADVSDMTSIETAFNELKSEKIQIDCCINNAWLALWEDEFTQVAWDNLQTMIDTNIKWFTKVAHRVIPFLKQTEWHLFNMSSVAGIECYDGGHVYGASKAYVKFLSKSLRLEVFGTWVRITDISPGSVDTEWFSSTRFKWDIEKVQAVYKGYEPLHAEDIANTILFCFESPKHVNIEYLSIMPTAQAAARKIYRT